MESLSVSSHDNLELKHVILGDSSIVSPSSEFESTQIVKYPQSDLGDNCLVLKESTDETYINEINDKWLKFFDSYDSRIANSINTCDFSDGINNDVTEEILSFFNMNFAVACTWLNKLFTKYQDNQLVISGILRAISFLNPKSYSDFLMPIVRAGLSDKSALVQESALSVIDHWGTESCVSALSNMHFSTTWLNDYAKSLI